MDHNIWARRMSAYTERVLRGCKKFCEPLERKQKWKEEGQGELDLESFWGSCPSIFLLLVQTLLELWDIPPRPHSLSLP